MCGGKGALTQIASGKMHTEMDPRHYNNYQEWKAACGAQRQMSGVLPSESQRAVLLSRHFGNSNWSALRPASDDHLSRLTDPVTEDSPLLNLLTAELAECRRVFEKGEDPSASLKETAREAGTKSARSKENKEHDDLHLHMC
jgi:hypothetical protein